MTRIRKRLPVLYFASLLAACLAADGHAQANPATTTPTPSGTAMSHHARGTFTVKVQPQVPDNAPAKAATGLSRLSLDKKFTGALDATSGGEMLAAGSADHQNGAYVAMEIVSGSLDGRKGSFACVHRALMRNGVPQEWTVTVVPGSGSGELVGLEGAMTITITDGRHDYDFEYRLAGE